MLKGGVCIFMKTILFLDYSRCISFCFSSVYLNLQNNILHPLLIPLFIELHCVSNLMWDFVSFCCNTDLWGVHSFIYLRFPFPPLPPLLSPPLLPLPFLILPLSTCHYKWFLILTKTCNITVYFLCLLLLFMCVWSVGICKSECSRRPEASDIPRAGVSRWLTAAWCGGWGFSWGPLQEHYTLFTAEASPRASFILQKNDIIVIASILMILNGVYVNSAWEWCEF